MTFTRTAACMHYRPLFGKQSLNGSLTEVSPWRRHPPAAVAGPRARAPSAATPPPPHQRAARPSWRILWLPGLAPAPATTPHPGARASSPHPLSSRCRSSGVTLFPDILVATRGLCLPAGRVRGVDCRHHLGTVRTTSGIASGVRSPWPGLPARARPGRGGGPAGRGRGHRTWSPSAAPTTRCGSNFQREKVRGGNRWACPPSGTSNNDLALPGRVAVVLTLSAVSGVTA